MVSASELEHHLSTNHNHRKIQQSKTMPIPVKTIESSGSMLQFNLTRKAFKITESTESASSSTATSTIFRMLHMQMSMCHNRS